jgi:hypothetical protein
VRLNFDVRDEIQFGVAEAAGWWVAAQLARSRRASAAGEPVVQRARQQAAYRHFAFTPVHLHVREDHPSAALMLRMHRASPKPSTISASHDQLGSSMPSSGPPGTYRGTLPAWVAGMPRSRSHTSTRNNTSHYSRAAGDLQQDQRRIVAHQWDISLQRSPRMIFDAMNQGQPRPGHSPTNPICPFSPFSQAVAPQHPPTCATQRAKVPLQASGGQLVGVDHERALAV